MSIERQCVVGGHPEVVVKRGERMTAEAPCVSDESDRPTRAQRDQAALQSIRDGLCCGNCRLLTERAVSMFPRLAGIGYQCACPPPVEYQAQTDACPECWGWLHKARGDGGCRCDKNRMFPAWRDVVAQRPRYPDVVADGLTIDPGSMRLGSDADDGRDGERQPSQPEPALSLFTVKERGLRSVLEYIETGLRQSISSSYGVAFKFGGSDLILGMAADVASEDDNHE